MGGMQDTEATMDTLMPTTERGPLMPNLRPRLTQLCSTVPTVTVPILMPTLDCTTDMPDTTATPDLTDTPVLTVTDMVATEDTSTDKSQYLKVQSKSSKRTSLLVI